MAADAESTIRAATCASVAIDFLIATTVRIENTLLGTMPKASVLGNGAAMIAGSRNGVCLLRRCSRRRRAAVQRFAPARRRETSGFPCSKRIGRAAMCTDALDESEGSPEPGAQSPSLEEVSMTSAARLRPGETSASMSPVYQVLAEDIKAIGVEAVFGLMSDDTALFATALDTAGVRFYGARHENTAIAMADGYAYAAGRLGVAVVGRGPALDQRPARRGLRQPHRLAPASRLWRGRDHRPAQRTGPRLQGDRRRRRAQGGRPAHVLGDQPALGPCRAGRRGGSGDGGRCGQPAPADQRAARRHRAAGGAVAHFTNGAGSGCRRRRKRSRRQPPSWPAASSR